MLKNLMKIAVKNQNLKIEKKLKIIIINLIITIKTEITMDITIKETLIMEMIKKVDLIKEKVMVIIEIMVVKED